MGFFSAPGPLELIVILVVALIVLGPARLPDAARSVGRGMREFRESLSGFNDEPDEDPYDEIEDEYAGEDVEPGADDPDEDDADPEPASEKNSA
jgi:sec-independent protein translocase protein TatA